MARATGQTATPTRPRRAPTSLAARFEDAWWMESEGAYADSLNNPGDVKTNQKHWIGADPMEAELYVDGEFVPGLASFEHGTSALATRESSCYSGERPGNRGLFHTGCGGGPTGAGEFAIFSLNSGVMAVGEGNYGRLGADQQHRYTDANAETLFARADRRTTRPTSSRARCRRSSRRFAPSGAVATPPNIDRCWTCRSMFMQAWGNYGTAWPVIHQQLGVRPDLGNGRLDVMPQVPDGARLRFFLTSEHTPTQIRAAVRTMREELNGLGKRQKQAA